MSKKSKRAKSKAVTARKQAKDAGEPDYESQPPQWSFTRFDKIAQWCDHGKARCCFRDIADKLKSYERLTWKQIRAQGQRDHVIDDLTRIIPEARKRLQVLKLTDCELWRLRFSWDERLWGVKIGRVFYVLWYDPCHTVCP